MKKKQQLIIQNKYIKNMNLFYCYLFEIYVTFYSCFFRFDNVYTKVTCWDLSCGESNYDNHGSQPRNKGQNHKESF